MGMGMGMGRGAAGAMAGMNGMPYGYDGITMPAGYTAICCCCCCGSCIA